ncbi:hypothetical protein ACFQ1E_17470 [Sphingomonas canadensis]|uniref:HTH cro/C1-type domain-containing protein n=1 Tax=Sphingomonas canadensis TaxID=1219257 RepID=A0ABW3H9K6_9SPHN|nr:hypothetical protein [Sphingomonas canadensis]MCW3837837.1 hypothetical protein [Sphingomonas canadensis]
MVIKPGIYLQMRRQAAGLSLRQAAEIGFAALPHRDLDRVERQLALLEQDATHVSRAVIARLQLAYDFSREIYEQLLDHHFAGPGGAEPRLCRRCACSEHDACLIDPASSLPAACRWVAADLCSRCAGPGDDVAEGDAAPARSDETEGDNAPAPDPAPMSDPATLQDEAA